MTVNTSGTVNFWVDMNRNPGAFTDGVNYRWSDFVVDGEHCVVASEGRTLTATMNPGTDRSVKVFSAPLELDPDEAHMVTVTWSAEHISLYVDGDVEYALHLDELS